MSMDLTGISNINEYYTNHYFSSVFEENAESTISGWRNRAKEEETFRTPWASLRECGKQFYPVINRFNQNRNNIQTLQDIRTLADSYLSALGYPEAKEFNITADEQDIPVYLEMTKSNGAPLLWVVLSHGTDEDSTIMTNKVFSTNKIDTDSLLYADEFVNMENEELISKLLFGLSESPRFLMIVSMNQIALIDREKWNSKRYLQFELEDIFARREETTLQAMAVLLHKESICPNDGKILLDTLSDNSQRHASGVSQDLKYALRESIELLGNEALYYLRTQENTMPEDVDAGQLTLECLRYMYRMLFVLFIEARPELGFAPIKEQTYFTGYSLESLRDIADNIRDDVDEVGDGYYLHETLSKLYKMIYTGYPSNSDLYSKAIKLESMHDLFVIHPLKAHIFDPEYTPTLQRAKLRNRTMLRIVDLMSLTRATGKKNSRRGRISYANLGINQMGAVYEALLSYRGFIAKEDLYEVKAKGEKVDDLDVGYFVPERELDQYTEDERVRLDDGKLRIHPKGEFIYRLAGREREKSASYYTPECLTQCLVKYALKELLKDKTADEILNLTVCEPAMGSAAFLNEAINQLAEAYLDKKQKEIGETVPSEMRFTELQKIKMYIADNNVFGIDLNPVAVELAEVSLWLNTIYEGGYVPWFGAQLVNGNSLIGARRQGYAPENLTATSKNIRWFEMAPERIPFGRSAAQKNRIYHFLLGDPGMCSYSDKVIKSLAPDNIKAMNAWNKEFNKPYTDADIASLKELCKYVDKLWKEQIKARKELKANTVTALDVFGHKDSRYEHNRSIREKDKFLQAIYKSEKAANAGAYARLKFAMDYWCSLWFWPIDKVEELPSRSEFLYDMDLILHGVMQTQAETSGQLGLFGDDEPDEEGISLQNTEVNLAQLCDMFPRLAIARDIANANKFMHWELEFAEIFADKGGFDLTIGNPPWVKLTWTEQGVLSDKNPMFAVKKLTATQTAQRRSEALEDSHTNALYFAEYESMSGQQAFLGATQNYPDLGGAVNLFKCFLPNAWMFGNENGVSAFVHPDGVYDDPKGGKLRERLYPKLKYHFQFTNEYKLFAEVDHHTGYSLNVYGNNESDTFETISNLFAVETIEECYDNSIEGNIPGLKDDNGNWNVNGHPGRVVTVGRKELELFAKLFDGSDYWEGATLPAVHAQDLLDVLKCFLNQNKSISSVQDDVYFSGMWNETSSQKDKTIIADCTFPENQSLVIYSGAQINMLNPIFQTTRRVYKVNSDYDRIDLTQISDDYLIRVKYQPGIPLSEYMKTLPNTSWNTKMTDDYMLVNREMVGCSAERTLSSAIIAPKMSYVNTIFGVAFKDKKDMLSLAGSEASIVYDYLVKTIGKAHVNVATTLIFPIIQEKQTPNVILRTLLMNCVTSHYAPLFNEYFDESFTQETWSKQDSRLDNKRFSSLTDEWNWNTPLRTDYERRQALVEIDVLTAMALGMTLQQLKTIYRIQFPVLQQYEADTWYDANGRIVFTTNRSLTGVGFDRPTWEKEVKGAEAGKVFTRTITDDTQPGGPVERTIEYVAPFDKCDREQDYETAWKFFEEKYR